MTSPGVDHACGRHGGYRHEAFFYDGADAFVGGVVPFIREAADAGEPILVVLPEPRLALTREAVGGHTEGVMFADMQDVGDNPARIIPAWRAFLRAHAAGSRRVRGIGEPISTARSAAELAECERHEALLNVAFAGSDFWLLCPYDAGALEPAVIEAARRNHPYLRGAGGDGMSPSFPGDDVLAAPFDAPLPPPPPGARVLRVSRSSSLHELRGRVAAYGCEAGLSQRRAADLVLAVGELVTNSVLHGGGEAVVMLWREDDAVVCEVRDRGRFEDPLAGRVEPAEEARGGRGLWIANQVCDLVQMRSFPDGAAVRVRRRLA